MSDVATVTVKLDGEHMDVLLTDIRELHERIDALEHRIERIDGMLDGMGRGAESRFEAIERRIAAMERKLNHKGGNA